MSSLSDIQLDTSSIAAIAASFRELYAAQAAQIEAVVGENAELKKRIVVLERRHGALQQNTGVKFPHFTELPLEIRRNIWEYALRAPQMHIIKDSRVSSSKINSVVNSCEEAREVADRLQLDYFILNRQDPSGGDRRVGAMKNYVNLSVDTIWMNPETNLHGGNMPYEIEWTCGRCDRKSVDWSSHLASACVDCFISKPAFEVSPRPSRVRQLAINLTAWEYSVSHNPRSHTTIDLIWSLGAEKVLFVVGDILSHKLERDIEFVSPSLGPHETFLDPGRKLRGRSISNGTDPMDNINEYSTWRQLEENWLRFFEDYKMDRLFKRRGDLAGMLNVASPRWIEEYNSSLSSRDMSSWIVPRVEFVEVRSFNSGWIAPPREPAVFSTRSMQIRSVRT